MQLLNGVKYLDSTDRVIQVFTRISFIDRGYDILLEHYSPKNAATIIAEIVNRYRDNNYFGVMLGYIVNNKEEFVKISSWEFGTYNDNGETRRDCGKLIKPYIE